MKPVEVLTRADDLPRDEAVRLLMAAAGLTRAGLAAANDLAGPVVARYDEMVDRRRRGEPLQHIEGTIPFGPVELMVDRRALIPRPETELLWEMAAAALGEAGPGSVIVDLCTGSGNLALALKRSFPEAQVLATDISGDALALARENARRARLDVEFLEGDLFAPLPDELMGRVDLLVANPPYLAEAELDTLPPEVRDWEPHAALVAGTRGDELLARIADDAYWWLGVGGWLFCEIAPGQADRALGMFADLDREVRPDLTGRQRILVGRKGASCCG